MRHVLTTAALLLLVGLPATAPGNATVDPPQSPAGAAVGDGGRPETTITLVSGDRVVMRGGAVVAIRPGPGREHMRFSRFTLGGEAHVTPADAGRLLAAGRLDERLFNVTRLAEWNYDDRSRASVPLIAKRASAGTPSRMEGVSTRGHCPEPASTHCHCRSRPRMHSGVVRSERSAPVQPSAASSGCGWTARLPAASTTALPR